MPLYCSIMHEPDRIIVRGVGRVTCSEFAGYLAEAISEGVQGYAKLILLGDSVLALSRAEVDAVAATLVAYDAVEQPGPVAMVAGNALNLDMAILLKQRVATASFAIFADMRDAVRWLAAVDVAQPRVRTIAPVAWTAPFQPGGTRVVASS